MNRPGEPISNLGIGTIIEVDGTHVVAELDDEIVDLSRIYGGVVYPIGQFGSILRVHSGRRIVYGFVSRLRMKSDYERERGVVTPSPASGRVVEANLFGEGEWAEVDEGGGRNWELRFERGVGTFPLPRQRVYLTPRSELAAVYGRPDLASVEIGVHVGSGGAPAFIDVNEFFSKHAAILGATGSGKSGAVAAIIRAVLEGKPKGGAAWTPQIIILDPHNEYGAAFPEHKRLSTDEGSLQVPYWMLDLEETLDLVIGKTEHAATSQTNIVKNALLKARREAAALPALSLDVDKITVDSPIPYVLGDPGACDKFGMAGGARYTTGFVGAVNEQRPSNQDQKQHEEFNRVLRKLETLLRDTRMRFMLRPWDGMTDAFADVVATLVGGAGGVRVVDLSGVPNEVAGSAASAIARTVFQVKLWQSDAERERSPIVLVCEEAHRYVPNSGDAQYSAARSAVRRLAKEGRKYGIGLVLVSQRPSEVDATVLSQCGSWVVLRLVNETDRNHVKAVLPDSLADMTKVLSALRRREAIVVGQACSLPSRMMVRKLSDSQRPRSHDVDFMRGWSTAGVTEDELREVGRRWRFQIRPPGVAAARGNDQASGTQATGAPPPGAAAG